MRGERRARVGGGDAGMAAFPTCVPPRRICVPRREVAIQLPKASSPESRSRTCDKLDGQSAAKKMDVPFFAAAVAGQMNAGGEGGGPIARGSIEIKIARGSIQEEGKNDEGPRCEGACTSRRAGGTDVMRASSPIWLRGTTFPEGAP